MCPHLHVELQNTGPISLTVLCPTNLMITLGTLEKSVGEPVEALHCRGLGIKQVSEGGTCRSVVPPGITQQIGNLQRLAPFN